MGKQQQDQEPAVQFAKNVKQTNASRRKEGTAERSRTSTISSKPIEDLSPERIRRKQKDRFSLHMTKEIEKNWNSRKMSSITSSLLLILSYTFSRQAVLLHLQN